MPGVIGKLRAMAQVNRLWLTLSVLVGVAFVPIDFKLEAVAWIETSLLGAFAAPFVILFLPILAIAAVSEDPPLTISISTLVGVASTVALSSIWGFPGAGVLMLAMFMACLLTAPAIIAGASLGSWLKTSPSLANLFERSSLMKFLAFATGVLFVEILYHRLSLPFGMLTPFVVQFVVASLVVLVSMALSTSPDRKPTPTVLLMMGGILLGIIVDVSLDKVDRNLWPIEIFLMWAAAAPGMILGNVIGTNFGNRRRNRPDPKSA
jgi:hypothetical protein